MIKTKLKKHVADAVNALLALFGFNINTLKREDLEKLPEAVRAAVMNLLPEGWLEDNPQPEVSDVRYLSISAAEKYASVSRWTLGRAYKRQEIVLIKLGASKSSKVLVDRAEIDRWLKSRRCR